MVAVVVAAVVVEEDVVGAWIHRVRHNLAGAEQVECELGPSCPRNHCAGAVDVVDAAGDVLHHNPCLKDPMQLPETGPLVGDEHDQINCQKRPNSSPNGRYHHHQWETVHQKDPNDRRKTRWNVSNASNSGERLELEL